MTQPHPVAVVIGSLRKKSISGRVARALMSLAPPSLDLRIVPIGDLPLYNEDLETADAPRPWMDFRQSMRGVAAVLFVTPEYNRSVPAPLKNALDVGSRPYGKSVFDGKPAAIVSQSPGAIGGFGANHAIRQSLVFLNMPTLQMPEAYISNSAALFDDAGALVNDGTRTFLSTFMQAFADWIDTHAAASSQ